MGFSPMCFEDMSSALAALGFAASTGQPQTKASGVAAPFWEPPI